LYDGTVALRRRLHEWPEVGNDLPTTREAVLESLDGLPLDITLHETTSGIAALLTGGKPGPTVMLRGDMDALPMPEDTGLEFASRNENMMHACGHDTHTAMLATTARLLSERKDDLPGRVLFMFQPGEEGHHGAKFMLDEGLLDVAPLADGTPSPVTAAYALHITTAIPAGWVTGRGGPTMASSDEFTIEVRGKGGHASEPFRTLDPIPVARYSSCAGVRPGSRYRHPDPHGYHVERHPGDRIHQRHHSRGERVDAKEGARRLETSRRRHRLDARDGGRR
jgi:hippurate hydrolase